MILDKFRSHSCDSIPIRSDSKTDYSYIDVRKIRSLCDDIRKDTTAENVRAPGGELSRRGSNNDLRCRRSAKGSHCFRRSERVRQLALEPSTSFRIVSTLHVDGCKRYRRLNVIGPQPFEQPPLGFRLESNSLNVCAR